MLLDDSFRSVHRHGAVGPSTVTDNFQLITSEQLATLVDTATIRLEPHVMRTPTVRLPWLDTANREVWAKLECWQRTGSFKYRGAINAMLDLPSGTDIVASSAGNHGLAVATAAVQLGHRADIFVPIGASPLKIRRIEEVGATVHVIGRDLQAATMHALEFSARHNFTFVSAYSDVAVAAGNGTAIAEAVDEAGSFDIALVPLGGGGLISGIGAWNRLHAQTCQTVGIHPQVFGRQFDSQPLSEALFGETVPTFADGLAVQLHQPSLLRQVLDNAVDRVIEIDETGFTTAVYALLYKEGLLAEGAGASGVAALLADESDAISGRVLVVVTGGNISTSEVARSMATEVSDVEMRRNLGMRQLLPALDVDRQDREISQQNETAQESFDEVMPFSVTDFWRDRLLQLDARQQGQDLRDAEFRRLTDYQGLERDLLVDDVHDEISQLCRSMIDLTVTQVDQTEWELEERTRYIMHIQSFLQTARDRTSPAYDQSKRTWFYDTTSQGSAGVNYARYGNHQLRTLEQSLKSMLGFDREDVELLLTSSGMAAYQLLEGFLLRHVLQPGDTIARSPYVYFEADQQLLALDLFNHVYAEAYEAASIVTVVEKTNARVLFIDPIANHPGLPTIDLRSIVNAIGKSDWSDRWLVIDGSLLSGGIDPFAIFSEPNHPKVLYYESASKYVQLGLDLQMSGICIFPINIESTLRAIRRNSGLIMYWSSPFQPDTLLNSFC